MKGLLLLCATMLMSACQYPILLGVNTAGPYAVHIQSDTRWHGTVSGQHVSGFSNRTVNVPAGVPVCFTIHKETSAGLLRAYILPQYVSPSAVEPIRDRATTKPFAVISGCL